MTHSGADFVNGAGESLELVLYMFATCPYCQRVLAKAGERGLQLPQRDIRLDKTAWAELLRVGGKTTVPCLFVNGEPMYESAVITAFLDDVRVKS